MSDMSEVTVQPSGERSAAPGESQMITPADGWPAQPALTPRQTFLDLTRADINTLTVVADTLEKPVLSRRIAVREELRRRLAGVIAHCETLRMALEKGRCS